MNGWLEWLRPILRQAVLPLVIVLVGAWSTLQIQEHRLTETRRAVEALQRIDQRQDRVLQIHADQLTQYSEWRRHFDELTTAEALGKRGEIMAQVPKNTRRLEDLWERIIRLEERVGEGLR